MPKAQSKKRETRYAGFWIRFLASFLDLIIVGIPSILFYVTFYYIGLPALDWLLNLAVICLIIFLDGTYGGTPGKLILGIKIVNEKNDIIGIPHAILRYACKMAASIILGIGLLMVAFTEKKQGLHDKMARTYVVYKN